MTRAVSDVLDIMRVAIGRRNENDPDSDETKLLQYVNDFYSLTQPNDTKLFESFGTLTFTIDETNTTGVYTFNDVGADSEFINISQEAYISLYDPVNNSVSWNQLPIYQDPGEFFAIWGINNDEILIAGYPTNLLFYGNEFTFRTIPDTEYLIKIYGYKRMLTFHPLGTQICLSTGGSDISLMVLLETTRLTLGLMILQELELKANSIGKRDTC